MNTNRNKKKGGPDLSGVEHPGVLEKFQSYPDAPRQSMLDLLGLVVLLVDLDPLLNRLHRQL